MKPRLYFDTLGNLQHAVLRCAVADKKPYSVIAIAAPSVERIAEIAKDVKNTYLAEIKIWFESDRYSLVYQHAFKFLADSPQAKDAGEREAESKRFADHMGNVEKFRESIHSAFKQNEIEAVFIYPDEIDGSVDIDAPKGLAILPG